MVAVEREKILRNQSKIKPLPEGNNKIVII
jgi:hypothetical protein